MTKPRMKLYLVPVGKPVFDDCDLMQSLERSTVWDYAVSARNAQTKEVDIKELADYIQTSLPIYPMPDDYINAINDFMEGK